MVIREAVRRAGVMNEPRTDGAQQETPGAAEAAAADDQHLGVLRHVDERRDNGTGHHAMLDGNLRRVGQGIGDDSQRVVHHCRSLSLTRLLVVLGHRQVDPRADVRQVLNMNHRQRHASQRGMQLNHKDLVPRPLQANADKPTKYGVIYFGSTSRPWTRRSRCLKPKGHYLDTAALRALPFHSSVTSFIAEHDFVFVVEQNRDAQLRSLIVNECGIDPVRLVPILHYDGTPITARFIARAIGDTSTP